MIEVLRGGGVTSALGFKAGGTYAGLKTVGEGNLDLGIVVSDTPAAVAGTFTTNKVESRSVTLSRQRVASGTAQAVVANSGCANCCVGGQGLLDALEMTALAARQVGVDEDDVLVASTGMIGVELPMALIRQNIGNVRVSEEGGNDFARSIMTTDTHEKEAAVSLEIDGRVVTVGGTSKGVGMIHPNMATMLCFMTTDAPVEGGFLSGMLREAVDSSFNMISVDGDQSTNDTVILLANGAAGGEEIGAGTSAGDALKEAVSYVSTTLAKALVRDGEGAQRLLEAVVEGARDVGQARRAAREISGSLLVKAMVHGRDPNWGRVMMALGKSGIDFEESKVDLFINGIHIVHEGKALAYLMDAVVSAMSVPEVQIKADVHAGDGCATAWGCDLTEEYVTFNSAYST